MESLGPRIKELRQEAGLNKAALARKVGVSDVTISYWESGAIKQIGHERLVALAQALDCPLSRLIEGESDPRPTPLYLRRALPLPWQGGHAQHVLLPFELVPAQHWDGDCYLVTPAPDETFDFIAAGDLIAVAPTETFQQPGLYLVEQAEHLAIRRVSQEENGELRFEDGRGEVTPYRAEIRLQGKLVGRWQAAPL